MTTFNDHGRLWVVDADDILTFNNHDDPTSGFRGIRIRKIVFVPNASGDGVSFQTLKPSITPALTLEQDTFSVTGTDTITDDAGSALTQTNCAVGSWLYLYESSTGNNEGWWHIKANDASHNYVEVANGTNVLTNDTSAQYSIKVYVPEECMVLVSPTGDTGGASVESETLDWGDKGRWYQNLAMYAMSASGTAYIYLL